MEAAWVNVLDLGDRSIAQKIDPGAARFHMQL